MQILSIHKKNILCNGCTKNFKKILKFLIEPKGEVYILFDKWGKYIPTKKKKKGINPKKIQET